MSEAQRSVELTHIRIVLCAIVFGVWLTLCGGCTITVTPPSDVDRPAKVILLDHGRHASLLLPNDGGMVRYAYGDWGYYALGNKNPCTTIAAVLLPSRGALGRRILAAPPTLENALAYVEVPIEDQWLIAVEQARVDELRRQLEAIFQRHGESQVENALLDLTLVEHPSSYSLLYTSNHAVADWLGELGCEVNGLILISQWRVRQPSE